MRIDPPGSRNPLLDLCAARKYDVGMDGQRKKRTEAQLYADRHLRTGRPPKPADTKKGERITVNMTRTERQALEADAARAGMSLSAYLVSCWKRVKSQGA